MLCVICNRPLGDSHRCDHDKIEALELATWRKPVPPPAQPAAKLRAAQAKPQAIDHNL